MKCDLLHKQNVEKENEVGIGMEEKENEIGGAQMKQLITHAEIFKTQNSKFPRLGQADRQTACG